METRRRSAASGAPNNVDNLASPPGLYATLSMTDRRRVGTRVLLTSTKLLLNLQHGRVAQRDSLPYP